MRTHDDAYASLFYPMLLMLMRYVDSTNLIASDAHGDADGNLNIAATPS